MARGNVESTWATMVENLTKRRLRGMAGHKRLISGLMAGGDSMLRQLTSRLVNQPESGTSHNVFLMKSRPKLSQPPG
jgi:hypothetical protein